MSKANLESDREYRKIPSLNFLYEITCDGKKIRNARSKRHLSCHKNNQGYYITDVCISGKKRGVTIHSLVAECWLGSKPEGYEIDHIDKDKTNNHYTNLRYVTHSENNLNRVMTWKRPVRIVGLGENITFDSIKACTNYLTEKYNKTFGSIRGKFSKHRHRIFDYDVIYLNAETGHGNQEMGKEQSN